MLVAIKKKKKKSREVTDSSEWGQIHDMEIKHS